MQKSYDVVDESNDCKQLAWFLFEKIFGDVHYVFDYLYYDDVTSQVLFLSKIPLWL